MDAPRGPAQLAARLAAELRAAQDALTEFDAGSLRSDDGTYDTHALYRRRQLLAAVETARARLAAAQGQQAPPATP